MMLGQSLVMTKLFINAAIELATDAQEFKVMDKALMRTCRRLAKSWSNGRRNHVNLNFGDAEIKIMVTLYGKGSTKLRTVTGEKDMIVKVPNMVMHQARARRLYLPRMLKRGPNIIFALLHGVAGVQSSGPDMIIKDMSWLHEGHQGQNETEKRRSSARSLRRGHIKAERSSRVAGRSRG